MKGLAIYSLVVTCIALVSLLADLLQGIEIATNVWAISMWIPVAIFLGLYLKKGGK